MLPCPSHHPGKRSCRAGAWPVDIDAEESDKLLSTDWQRSTYLPQNMEWIAASTLKHYRLPTFATFGSSIHRHHLLGRQSSRFSGHAVAPTQLPQRHPGRPFRSQTCTGGIVELGGSGNGVALGRNPLVHTMHVEDRERSRGGQTFIYARPMLPRSSQRRTRPA